MPIDRNLRELAARWATVPAGERANAQLYLAEFARALDEASGGRLSELAARGDIPRNNIHIPSGTVAPDAGVLPHHHRLWRAEQGRHQVHPWRGAGCG